ncbi:uncharacterized protein polg2 [Stegostoma tigrinum]|uniref:uncharacterized protein polg2 n=1 Tax=Stegostoma tigrinum TaxID=3053191 RepID=UPI00286FF88D|nr:uncharacterized protein polg2 [Stegostoma tigrinum]
MNIIIMELRIMKLSLQSFLKRKQVPSNVLQQHWQVFGLCLVSRICNKSSVLSGFTEALIELCQSRHFITGDIITQESVTNGWYNYGHLGMEFKKNLASEWWNSMVLSREQVFGVATPHKLMSFHNSDNRSLRLVESTALQVPSGNKDLTKEEIVALLDNVLKQSTVVRPDLLKGAIQEYTRSLNLVNRKLPFGLAEIGMCYQPSPPSKHPTACNTVRTGEVEIGSLVWFSSPRTSGQWLDYWIRQRLLWWRKHQHLGHNHSKPTQLGWPHLKMPKFRLLKPITSTQLKEGCDKHSVFFYGSPSGSVMACFHSEEEWVLSSPILVLQTRSLVGKVAFDEESCDHGCSPDHELGTGFEVLEFNHPVPHVSKVCTGMSAWMLDFIVNVCLDLQRFIALKSYCYENSHYRTTQVQK